MLSQKAELRFWNDETGLRLYVVRGHSFAPRGRMPVVRPSHKRAWSGPAKSRSNLRGISAVTNKGGLRWMVFGGAMEASSSTRFLQRLIRDAGCKVFLVLDNLPVHRVRVVQNWLAGRTAQADLFHLPAYSPVSNPDEGLNAHFKHNLVSHMCSLSRWPSRTRSYFGHHTFRYAA